MAEQLLIALSDQNQIFYRFGVIKSSQT